MKADWQSHRFLRPDGTELRVRTCGPPSDVGLVFCDGVGCDGFAWRYLAPALESRYRMVLPTYRGHGESGLAGGITPDAYRPGAGDGYGVRTLAADAFAAMDEVGLTRGVFIGHSMGVQVALEAALLAPERVIGLGLVCGSFGRPLDTVGDKDTARHILPWLQALVARYPGTIKELAKRLLPTELAWQIACLVAVDRKLMSRADLIDYMDHMARIDQRVFLETLEQAGKHTTEGRLGEITAPTIVIGGEHDSFTPFWVSEVLAARIAGAEIEMIRGGTHTAPLEHREHFEQLMRRFLEQRVRQLPGYAPVSG